MKISKEKPAPLKRQKTLEEFVKGYADSEPSGIKDLFNQCDKDGNGYIERSELAEVMRELGITCLFLSLSLSISLLSISLYLFISLSLSTRAHMHTHPPLATFFSNTQHTTTHAHSKHTYRHSHAHNTLTQHTQAPQPTQHTHPTTQRS